ncbi:RNA-directed DNA polymerase, eukaryota [Artemisia annua]|uniref:RNA-directed DNA polymerase, eukaryota n=1 Tax=Artemisia annua TaxID=35608 RepID=A0A2U1NID1_ARTAN|nr:RNA-directed DNA polymerase, eukaryota [Artemisia annua]
MEFPAVRNCWGNLTFNYIHSNSVGNSGGILCVWDLNSFTKVSHTLSDYFVIIRGKWLKNDTDIMFVAVYGPHDPRDKRMVWEYLTHVINQWNGNVVVMGDFNEVRFKSDRFGSIFNVQGADDFNSFIEDAGLEEVPLGGSAFTWCHKSATKMSKLDRFFISNSLLNSCPHVSAITLDRFLSDHRPILLCETNFDYGPIPFRFFHHWIKLDGFSTFVSDVWNSAPVNKDNGMRNLAGKLKFLKGKLREWIKSSRVKGKSDSSNLKEELRVLDETIDKGDRSDGLIQRRMEIMNDIQYLDQLHAMELAQKSKIKWAIEGDENTRFFHGVLNKKRNQMAIRGVLVDGKWIDQPSDVKMEFFNHFRDRFSKPVENRITLELAFPKQISRDQQNELERMVTKEELKMAVWDCGTDKSPGPDGFSFGFFRHFWSILEKDVFEAVSHFFVHGDIPPGCNPSFITLIPKVPAANMVKDFRPISLIGCLYKIIAKILANRLVGVLEDIVHEVQSAFIANRQILDGPFIINEVHQWCKSKKKQSMLFKVDFEKAYDSVRWDFLDDVLNKFGFGNKWRNWIHCCLKSSRGSILVNGSPTEEFQFYKGLKQGDPLSPFLFILIMESLHISFQRVVESNMFKGIKLSDSLCISHMFYADDAVFVGNWSDENINTLTHVLDVFYRASGLKINMCKSKILGINVDVHKVNQAANKLGCLILSCPFSYLGSKVGVSMSRIEDWREVIDKVKCRLSKWKMKCLSIGGRLTLLKSVLGAMPIFNMSIFKVPAKVLKMLESIRGRFFNGHESDSRKAYWIKWDKVLANKDKGGLGVSSFFALNRGLMFKWVWRFLNNESSLWKKVIKAIHGDGGNIHNATRFGINSCWSSIVKEAQNMKSRGINIFDYLKLRLGKGNSIKFWDDDWYQGGILKDICPRMYALETRKDVTVCEKMKDPSICFSFRRGIRGGSEQDQFNHLEAVSNSITLGPREDRWVWSLEGSGEFSVASLRRKIDDIHLPNVGTKTRWTKLVPIKVNVLAWKVMVDALPTRWNLSRRGINIPSMLCPICGIGVESSSHLFFRCEVSRHIGQSLAKWWDIPVQDVVSYDDWKGWLISIRLGSKLKGVLEGVWITMWWYIWWYRNKMLFDDNPPKKACLFDRIVTSSFQWCRSRCKSSLDWNEWLKTPYLISL